MKKLLRKKEGFTLIELLIVVAIIGIIAGIAIPNFLGARSKARVTRAFADMRAIADALEMYYVDNTAYPAAPDEEGDPIPGLSPTYMTSSPRIPFPEQFIGTTSTMRMLQRLGFLSLMDQMGAQM